MANIQATFAKVLGAVLLLVGILGFVLSNPLLGLFGVNTIHNIVHILSGVIGLWAGFAMGGQKASLFNKGFGIVYGLVAVLGFVAPTLMFDLLGVNMADNILHVLIAVGCLGIGFGVKSE